MTKWILLAACLLFCVFGLGLRDVAESSATTQTTGEVQRVQLTSQEQVKLMQECWDDAWFVAKVRGNDEAPAISPMAAAFFEYRTRGEVD